MTDEIVTSTISRERNAGSLGRKELYITRSPKIKKKIEETMTLKYLVYNGLWSPMQTSLATIR